MPSSASRLTLRRAMLPVDPLDRVSGQIRAHRFADGGEKGLLAKACKKPEALQLVLHGVLHLRESQVDACRAQSLLELANGIGCSDVHAGHRLRRDHQPADRGW